VDELEGPVEGLEVAQVALLEARVVEGIEVIKRPDGMAGMEQALADMRANEAGAARDKEIHAHRLSDKANHVEILDNGGVFWACEWPAGRRDSQ